MKEGKNFRRVFLLVGEQLRVETPLGTMDITVSAKGDSGKVEYQFLAVQGAQRKQGLVTASGDWFDEWTGPRPCWNLYGDFRED